MPKSAPAWKLEGFLDRLDAWIAHESPTEDLRYIVTEWILTRFENPYQGVRRDGDLPNLWFGRVPDSHDGTGQVVVCSYWIEESKHTVRCDNFATLTLPL